MEEPKSLSFQCQTKMTSQSQLSFCQHALLCPTYTLNNFKLISYKSKNLTWKNKLINIKIKFQNLRHMLVGRSYYFTFPNLSLQRPPVSSDKWASLLGLKCNDAAQCIAIQWAEISFWQTAIEKCRQPEMWSKCPIYQTQISQLPFRFHLLQISSKTDWK